MEGCTVVSLATLVAMVPFARRALAMPGTTALIARLRDESAEHSRSREKLQLTQEQLRVATAASGVGLWDWLIDRNLATWDLQARRLFGIPQDATAGGAEYLLRFVEPADRADVAAALDASIARGEPFALRFGVVRPDGTRARVAARSSVVRDATGAAVRLSGAFVDVTAEERSRELFRAAVEASPNAMLLVDASGAIVMANSNAERVFGHAQGALLAMSVDALVPEAVRPRHAALRATYDAAPVARPMGAGRDLFGVRADGSQVPIEIGLNPVTTPDGAFVLASIIDITQRKRGEDLLRASLEEKETLLREVHHRVKNNLQVVSSMLSLQTSQVTDAAARAMFEECQTRVRTMAMIHESLYATGNLASLEDGRRSRSEALGHECADVGERGGRSARRRRLRAGLGGGDLLAVFRVGGRRECLRVDL